MVKAFSTLNVNFLFIFQTIAFTQDDRYQLEFQKIYVKEKGTFLMTNRWLVYLFFVICPQHFSALRSHNLVCTSLTFFI